MRNRQGWWVREELTSFDLGKKQTVTREIIGCGQRWFFVFSGRGRIGDQIEDGRTTSFSWTYIGQVGEVNL